MRHPDSRPAAALFAGTDTMPGIEHVVVLMLENRSYDNFLGMLGRGRGETPRGDGFTPAADGRPTATNSDPDGHPPRAFLMPATGQLKAQPSGSSRTIRYANGTSRRVRRAPPTPDAAAPRHPRALTAPPLAKFQSHQRLW
ncbi:MAG: hypothetical protein M3022_02665 [Actinomycetota bacterium]|nr:hypothetical protein [Actinomycetota bacterium]